MNYQILINKKNSIPLDFINQKDLIEVANYSNKNIYIEKETYKKYQQLEQFLKNKKGIIIGLWDGYRSIKDQEEIYEFIREKYGQKYADTFVAPPTKSEHHSGLAIDLNLNVDGN